jgi:hypothetical protein
MADGKGQVTLLEFVTSLYHGARADNTFKFLYGQPEEKVDAFFQKLFRHVVEAVDSGESDALGDFLQQAQVNGYSFPPDKPPFWAPKKPQDPVPLASLRKPLSESRVALFSSGGGRLPEQPTFLPEGMELPAAIRDPMKSFEKFPTLREIPARADTSRLVFEHVAYDLNAVQQDPNVVFPLDRMHTLAEQGAIKVAPKAYSYKGLSNLQHLVESAGPEWAERVRADGADAVLLVPG